MKRILTLTFALVVMITVAVLISCDESSKPEQHTHTYTSSTVSETCKSQGYSLYICSCGESFKGNYTDPKPHEYVNGNCSMCGEKEEIIEEVFGSEGLEYTLNNDGNSYTVTGIGTCTDTNIVISSIHDGLPVTSIGENAFFVCRTLVSVTIPYSVTSIGNGAFKSCDSLTSVTFSEGVTEIGFAAFRNCTSLNGVTLPSSLTTIGDYAFEKCNSLTFIMIPDNVTSIGKLAFLTCNELRNVKISDSVTTIGDGAFRNCVNLLSIVVDQNNPSYSSVDGNLYSKDGKTLIQYAIGKKATNFTVPDSVTRIGAFALTSCNKIERVTIPDSVTQIEAGALRDCINLVYITVDGTNTAYKTIDGNLYSKDGKTLIQYATGLNATSFVIPDGVTTIGEAAFYNSPNLTSVTIPDSVTTIGGGAFLDCVDLISVTIPDSVTTIGDTAFYNCKNIKTITYSGTKSDWMQIAKGRQWNKNSGIEAVKCTDCTIEPNEPYNLVASKGLEFTLNSDGKSYSVTGIGTCTDTDIVIPSTYEGLPVTGIADSAFIWCHRMKSIVLSKNITNIGESAFRFCGLTSVTLENGVENIGYEAFFGCRTLVEVINHSSLKLTVGSRDYGYIVAYAKEIHTGESKVVNRDGYLFYTYGERNYLVGYTGTDTAIILPKDYNGQEYEIVDWVFLDNYHLTSVTIPDSVTAIGAEAFLRCERLTYILIGNGVTSIGEGAFSGTAYYEDSANWDEDGLYIDDYLIVAENSENYVIRDGTRVIAGSAFSGCYSLCSVEVPDSVITIGDKAFFYCSNIKTVTYRGTSSEWMQIAKARQWNKNSGIEAVKCTDCTIEPNEPYNLVASKGLEFTLNSDGRSYSVTGIGTCTDTDIVIPSTYEGLPVTEIANWAFRDCTSLKNVTIPNSVTSIGSLAFYKCESLTSVTIPDSVTVIGASAFGDCESLTNVTIPDSVASIGSDAFLGTVYYRDSANWENEVLYIGNHLIKANDTISGSYTVKSGTKTIADSAFRGCSELTGVTIPDSVTSIDGRAFQYCSGLANVTLPDGIISISFRAFDSCTALTSVAIPDSVTSIGSYAFSGCSSLTSIIIGDSVTTIEANAFHGSGLTSIIIGDSVTTIEANAFYGSGLTSVTIPNSVTSIGTRAFASCANLTSIEVDKNNAFYTSIDGNLYSKDGKTLIQYAIGKKDTVFVIPSGVTTIGDGVFMASPNLINVTVHESVTSIGSLAFTDCSSLTTITVSENNTAYKSIDGNLYSKDGKTLIQYSIGKKDTVFVIPSGVTTIGDYAFVSCTNLAKITICDSVQTIGIGAFQNCVQLWIVTIPYSVTVINSSVFLNCDYLNSITYTGTKSDWNEIDKNNRWYGNNYNLTVNVYCASEGLEYELYDDGTKYSVTGIGTCTDTDIVIPSGYKGLPVIYIDSVAFENCTGLKSVTIHNGVMTIGSQAFDGCTGLKSVTIPDSVTTIGLSAFNGCTSLTGIYVSENNTAYRSIDGNLYTRDGETLVRYAIGKSATSFAIPDGVKSIGFYAFEDCDSLTSVTIPGSVTSIEHDAFANCDSLRSVTIPGSVTVINGAAFEDCDSLTSVTVSNGVNSIGNYAFYGCYNLKTIVIPDSVTQMGYNVFTGTKYYNSSSNWNNNVLYIGNHLIEAKTAISGNYVVNSNTVTIAGYAFGECVNLTGISIPGSVVCIGSRAFIGCTRLNKITLPNSLRWIGSYAFYNTGYYNNASNWDDGVLYIGNHLIEADEDISGTYLIKNGTITIADRAFDCRRGLTGVTIPNSVVTIGGGAFMECYNLSSVSIGSNVTYIGGSAFYCCYNLKTITIPNSVVTIDSYAFCGCGLVTVSMGTGVQTLGESAFEDAALVSIVLPNSLISIGDRAFNGCARLVEVINRSSINITAGSSLNGEVGYYAKEIHSGASKIVNQNGYLFYTHEGVNYLLCYIGTDTALTLPESYNGEKYSIHQYAFAGVEWLSVTISDNVTGIGNRVFAECDYLTSVTYEGTKEEWEKIQKDNEWAYRSDIETVHCSDGDITL